MEGPGQDGRDAATRSLPRSRDPGTPATYRPPSTAHHPPHPSLNTYHPSPITHNTHHPPHYHPSPIILTAHHPPYSPPTTHHALQPPPIILTAHHPPYSPPTTHHTHQLCEAIALSYPVLRDAYRGVASRILEQSEEDCSKGLDELIKREKDPFTINDFLQVRVV